MDALRPRLERGTPSLEGSCSIQLSYRSRKRGYTTTYHLSWQDKKIDAAHSLRHNARMLRNKWVKRLLCVIICLLGLTVISAGIGSYWLWCTPSESLDESDFHSSWTPVERIALQEAEQYILREYGEEVRKYMHLWLCPFADDEMKLNSWEWVQLEIVLRIHIGRTLTALRAAATGGNAQQTVMVSDEACPLALILCGSGNPDVVKALVRHGAPLNADGEIEGGNLYVVNSSLLMHVLMNEKFTKNQLYELADYLIQQPGEKLHTSQDFLLDICSFRKNDDALDWALARGLVGTDLFDSTQYRNINPALSLYSHRDFFFRLLDEGKINLNETRGHLTVLQSAVRHYLPGDMKYIRRMLEAGADPNLISTNPDALKRSGRNEAPLHTLLKHICFHRRKKEEHNTMEKVQLAELLMQYGAISPEYPLPEINPRDDDSMYYNGSEIKSECSDEAFLRALKARLEELYRRYGRIPTENSHSCSC